MKSEDTNTRRPEQVNGNKIKTRWADCVLSVWQFQHRATVDFCMVSLKLWPVGSENAIRTLRLWTMIWFGSLT